MKSALALRDKQLAANSELRAEYDRLGPVYEMVRQLISARKAAGLTQASLAKRMGTQQSVIARMENGGRLPSFEMVARYARATGRQIALVPVRN
ncbi:helix-turn-helix transcriptional regulator [Nisaea sp.]|uniref:helix-turn-helix domain-containing protein n=1 Tax=Nisaea sp. TaxID=2024842 RepID=UPI0032EA9BDD